MDPSTAVVGSNVKLSSDGDGGRIAILEECADREGEPLWGLLALSVLGCTLEKGSELNAWDLGRKRAFRKRWQDNMSLFRKVPQNSRASSPSSLDDSNSLSSTETGALDAPASASFVG